MLDIKWIRENPTELDNGLKKRGHEICSQKIIDLDVEKRALQTKVQDYQCQRNDIAKKMSQLPPNSKNLDSLASQGTTLKNTLHTLTEDLKKVEDELHNHLIRLPNIPALDVPVGEDEEANVEIRKWSSPRIFSFTPKPHYELGENLGLMNFERAVALSGSRFVVLRGDLARLERALASFMLDIHTQEFGYEEYYLPLLVTKETMFGTAQLPKFEEDFFQTTDGRWLIPTAEAPLTNLVSGRTVEEENLPLRSVAYTPCFRSEAGSAGKDTRGMFRQHQFSKVELVSVVHPSKSTQELERMTSAAESILQHLELPYKAMLLSSGDMGGAAAKTYDLEVWIPSQNMYREISSCSNCLDYQARRMNARFRPFSSDGKKTKPQFVHTLNGSGIAIGRTIVAILENYQREDGSISIPRALQKYMGGQETIVASKAQHSHKEA